MYEDVDILVRCLIEGSKDVGERKFKCANQETNLFSKLYSKTRDDMLISTLFGYKLLARNYYVKNGNETSAQREIVKFLCILREPRYHINYIM